MAPVCRTGWFAQVAARGRLANPAGGPPRRPIPFENPVMRSGRRTWLLLLVPALVAAGCSKQPRRGVGPAGKRPKGPQGFGNMMAKEWTKDLGDKSAEKRVRAANELANMGKAATSALPALERAAKDKDSKVSAAAKQAIAAIRQK